MFSLWTSNTPVSMAMAMHRLRLTFGTGETFQSKLQRLREEITKKKAVASVITLLDEVAWLFNLRGTDIDFNPGNRRPFSR
jgi:Xaa-Pro aminopeptidase